MKKTFGLGIFLLIGMSIYGAIALEYKHFEDKCYLIAANTEGAKVIYANKVHYDESCLIKLADGRIVESEALIGRVKR